MIDLQVEVETPKLELRYDEQKVLEAGGEAAREIVRAKIQASGHVETGKFLQSISVRLVGDGVEIYPDGQRNEIIAAQLKKRGFDAFAFTSSEEARIMAAMQTEVNRQIESKEFTVT